MARFNQQREQQTGMGPFSWPACAPIESLAVTFRAVLFDFGGVFTTSPFEAFTRYEAAAGLPTDLIRTINATNSDTNAWAKFERSEVDVEGFVELFDAEALALGHVVDGRRVLACLKGDLRPAMVTALDIIARDHMVGCITNNVATNDDEAFPSGPKTEVAAVMDRFEVIIESSKVGLRKPDPEIYQLALDRLSVKAEEAVYLDDLGINCKPAAALGMTAIKVTSGDQAIDELSTTLGIPLR
jgi:putative hydrolase of the HAD superfamily